MINPKRFHAGGVSILILHHRPIAECVSVITRSRLGHRAGRRRVASLSYAGRSGKGRIGWRNIVHVELEDFPGESYLGFSNKKVWPAGWRRRPAIVAGKQGETACGISVDYYTPQHRATHEVTEIEGIDAHFLIGGGRATSARAIKHIRRHVETVRPDAHLGIIREPRMRRVVRPKGIAPPAASDGIARL